MSQHVADAADPPPRDIRSKTGELLGDRAARFGNYFDRSLHNPTQLPACFKVAERLATRNLLDALDRFQYIVDNMLDLAGHQKT
jgi:hypothetical protein